MKNMTEVIENLIKVANEMDDVGMSKEAKAIDDVVESMTKTANRGFLFKESLSDVEVVKKALKAARMIFEEKGATSDWMMPIATSIERSLAISGRRHLLKPTILALKKLREEVMDEVSERKKPLKPLG